MNAHDYKDTHTHTTGGVECLFCSFLLVRRFLFPGAWQDPLGKSYFWFVDLDNAANETSSLASRVGVLNSSTQNKTLRTTFTHLLNATKTLQMAKVPMIA